MSLPAPPALALAEILGPTTRAYSRVEIYEEDGTTPWAVAPVVDSESGSISVDSTRNERRILDLVLNNKEGLLRLEPGGLWYDKIIKPFRGVFYNGPDGSLEVWAVQVGEFMLDDCSDKDFPSSISVRGVDYTMKLEGDKFYQTTSFSKGVSPESIIRAIATNGGISKFALPITSRITGKDFVFEAQETRWQAIKDICSAYSYDVFFDAAGVLVVAEFSDPVLTPSVYEFTLDSESVVASWEKSVGQSRLYNAVCVTGETSETTGLTVYAVAENNDPTSPSSIPNLGRRKTYFYTSAFITTVEQAQVVANNLLAGRSLEDYTVSLATLVLPWIEAGEIIKFDRQDLEGSEPTQFLLSSFSVPLGLGTMNPVAKRVVIAG